MDNLPIGGITKAALMQLGIFSFIATLLFKPQVLTAYTSGDLMFLDPLASAQVTITVMLFIGLVCLLLLSRVKDSAARLTLLAFAALPALTGFIVLFVHTPIIPILASAALGASTIVQVYFFARFREAGTSETLISAGICLILATIISHLAYLITEIHMFGTAIIAFLLVISGATQYIWGHGESAQRQTSIEKHASIAATVKGSVVSALPILAESLLIAVTLGTTWNQVGFDDYGSNTFPFLVGVLLGVLFVAVLYRVWMKSASADFLMYGASFPLTIAILLNIIGINKIGSILFMAAVLSEVCFLYLAWTGALLLDKSPMLSGVLTVFYISVFIATFGVFMTLSVSITALISQKLIAVLALLFLLYLLYFSVRSSRSGSVASTVEDSRASESTDMDEIMRARCVLFARKHGLSAREQELLPLFVVGMSGTEIGHRMFISPETVKTHRKRVYRKLGLNSHKELYDAFSDFET